VVQSEVINVSNLDLTFETSDGPVHALKNVDLKVNKGDFVSTLIDKKWRSQ
jgi:NitT/TauT family transport system ATP-binding protein